VWPYLLFGGLAAAGLAVALSKLGATGDRAGSVVDNELVGDYVWVPVGLLGDNRLKDLHEHVTSCYVTGYYPLQRLHKWANGAGIKYSLQTAKERRTLAQDGKEDAIDPLPPSVLSYIRPALDNHIKSTFARVEGVALLPQWVMSISGDTGGVVSASALQAAAAGNVKQLSDRQAWFLSEHLAKTTITWSPALIGWTYGVPNELANLPGYKHAIDGSDVGLCCFPPVAPLTGLHLSAWYAHWEQWIVSRIMFALCAYRFDMRGLTGPTWDDSLPYRIRSMPQSLGGGGAISPVAITDSNTWLCYIRTCSIFASIGLLPKPDQFPDVGWADYAKQQISALHSALGIKTGEWPSTISGFWKGIAIGASTVAAISLGGGKGWGKAGGQLVQSFMSQLGNTGPGEAYSKVWHESWKPVAVPRDQIGNGKDVIVEGMAEDYRFTVMKPETVTFAKESKPAQPSSQKVTLNLEGFDL